MPPLDMQNKNHDTNKLLLHKQSTFNFPMKILLKIFSSKECNSTIASNQQRQEHDNLATIQREKLKKPVEHSKNLQLLKT